MLDISVIPRPPRYSEAQQSCSTSSREEAVRSLVSPHGMVQELPSRISLHVPRKGDCYNECPEILYRFKEIVYEEVASARLAQSDRKSNGALCSLRCSSEHVCSGR